MTNPQVSGSELPNQTRAEAKRIARDHSSDPALALAAMQPFRLSSMQELILARKAMLQSTGLRVGEFSENSWGFPMFPYPVPTSEVQDGSFRYVPKHINYSYVGHPIFWIDPKLTAPTEAEQADPVRWNVRMFYLLLALGMMDGKTLQWFNAPNTKHISYNESDIQNFMADYPSVLDSVKITENDLLIPLHEVNQATAEALQRIAVAQEREATRFAQLQRTAISDANKIITGDQSWVALLKQSKDLSYAISYHAGRNEPVSQFVDETYKLKDRIVEYLSNIDALTLILAVPVIRDASYTTSMFSKVVSLVGTFESNVVDGQYKATIDQVLSVLFEKQGFREDTPDATVLSKLIQQHHETATQRLALAVHNFGRNENGLRPYGSVSEKDVFDQVQDLDLDTITN